MALNFTTTIALETGIEVANAYGRVAVADQASGLVLDALVEVYASEDAFLSANKPLRVPFRTAINNTYNRDTDGVDILNLAHDALIASLADQGYTATKSL